MPRRKEIVGKLLHKLIVIEVIHLYVISIILRHLKQQPIQLCNLQGSQCLTAPVYYFTASAEISEHQDKNKNRLELTTF